MTAAKLRAHTAKDLAQMARDRGVSGWHSMRKEELVRALLRVQKRKPSRNGAAKRNGSASKDSKNSSDAARSKSDPESLRKIQQLKRRLATVKNLAATSPKVDDEPRNRTDRLIVMVRGPYWLHAYWELNPRSVERAQAALGRHWHGAQPTLRLYQMASDGAAVYQRDIKIHGGVCNWYIDVQDPPQDYRVEIGYLAEGGTFHCLARSNQVSTPPADTSDVLDDNWTDVAEQADRIFAMSGGYSPQGASRELQELLEERLQRPLGSPMTTRFGAGAAAGATENNLQFAIDAEMIVYGVADRGSHVTLKGEPVALREDGSFTVRVTLPDRRQVVPVVASSPDGVEQQTIILAVERNTKVMETIVRDATV